MCIRDRHAAGQVAHFDADTEIPMRKLPLAFNAHLPTDISVRQVVQTYDTFHARFSAVCKAVSYTHLCLYLVRRCALRNTEVQGNVKNRKASH